MKKRKLTFTPVVANRRHNLTFREMFDRALGHSYRVTLIETPQTITFKLRKVKWK